MRVWRNATGALPLLRATTAALALAVAAAGCTGDSGGTGSGEDDADTTTIDGDGIGPDGGTGGDVGGTGDGDAATGDADAGPANAAPSVQITAPQEGALVAHDVPLTLTAAVSDDRDEASSLTARWTSDAGGDLGTSTVGDDGNTSLDVTELLPGTHTITITVTDSGDLAGTDTVQVVVNTPPGAPSVEISPTDPLTTDDLVAAVVTDSDEPDRAVEDITYRWRWLKDGAEVEGLTDATVPAIETARGQTWVVGVRAWDGLTEGPEGTAQVLIGNTAPTCTAATLEPTEPGTADPLTCTCDERADVDHAEGVEEPVADHCTFVDASGEELGTADAVDGACELTSDATARGVEVTCLFVPSDGLHEGEPAESATVTVVNTAPGAPTVTLDPLAGTVEATFTCAVGEPGPDPDDDELSYEITWLVNGFANPGALSATLSATELVSDDAGTPARGGDSVSCEIVADDGFTTSPAGVSATVVLDNAVPTGGSVVIEPPTAVEGTVLACVAEGAVDADGDDLTWAYSWFVGGVLVAGQTEPTLDSDWFSAGQTVTCTATPTDGTTAGEAIESSNEVLVGNTAPAAPEVSLDPTTGTVDTTFTCLIDVEAADPDEDEITYTVTWVVNGFANSTGLGEESVLAADLSSDQDGTQAKGGDAVQCQVIASDGEDTSPAALSAEVILVNTAPLGGSVSLVPGTATETSTLTCSAGGALDPDGDDVIWSYSWTVDGSPVDGADGPELNGASFDKHQTVSCTATPGDGDAQGAPVPSANSVTIDNTTPEPPTVTLEPAQATVETDLTCSITAESLDADDDELVYSYEWLVNGYPNEGVDVATLAATALVSDAGGTQATGGDEVSCRVVATDDDDASSLPGPSGGVVLDNTAPGGGFVTIQPAEPTELTSLSCLAGGALDPDGDNVTWSYTWAVNDEEVEDATDATLTPDSFAKGDLVSCTATPTDGSAEGPAVPADAAVEILNTPPSQPVPAIAPDTGVVGTEFSCNVLVASTDVDTGPETLTYSYSWYVDGVEAPQATGQLLVPAGALVSDDQGTPVRRGDAIRCEAVAADDEDAVSEPGLSEPVVLDNSPPEGGAVEVDPATAAEGDTLSCVADGATDPDADDVTWTYEWFVDDEPVDGADGVELASDAFGAGQTIRCTATPHDHELAGAPVDSANSVLVDNTLPTDPVVALDPVAGQVLDTFHCDITTASQDADGDDITYAYSWFVGAYQDTSVDPELDTLVAKTLMADAEGTPARGGDSITCQVVASDGLGFSGAVASQAVELSNTAPIGGVVEIDPPEAAEGVTLNCVATDASDPDFGDEVTWKVEWTVNGETVDGAETSALDSSLFGSNDVVACTATPTDGADDGVPVPSANQVLVGNSVPSAPVAGISPDTGTVETTFTCELVTESVDPDGEDVTYKYAWFVNDHLNQGVDTETVVPTELVSDADGTPARGGDAVKCRLRGFDGFGLSEPSFSDLVPLDNSPPREGAVDVQPETAVEGESLSCVPADVFDPDGDAILYTYTWFVGGEAVVDQTTDTLTSDFFDKGDVVGCSALPSDGTLDGELLEDLQGASVLNTLPSLSGASVDPAEAPRAGAFTCSFTGWADPDPADDPDQVKYRWLLVGDPDDTPIDGATSHALQAADLTPGDEVFCEVTPVDSDGDGEPVESGPATVINSAPDLEGVTLTPADAFADSELTCTPEGFTDDDDDGPVYSYTWLLGGEAIDGEESATLSGAFVKGDEVRCVVTPGDGFDEGEAVPSDLVVIQNTLPTLAAVTLTPDLATVCESFTCAYEGADDIDVADQPGLEVTFSWTVNDVLVEGADTDTLVIPEVQPLDVAVCTVSVWDGTVDENLLPVTTSVASESGQVFNTPPTLEAVTLGPVDPVRGTTVTCEASGFADAECDPPESYAYGWTYVFQGEEFPTDIETNTFDTSELPPGTLLSCGAVAQDGYDFSDTLVADPVFIQNGPPSAPVTGVSAPEGADGAVTCLLLTPAEDYEPIDYTYFWKIGDGEEFTDGESLDASQVDHCDLVACRAVASDGLAQASSEWSETVLPYGDNCNDLNACTDDSCADGGGCAHVDNAADCDDFDDCTHTDKCAAGTCEGEAYECTDDSDCTDNVCLGDGQCDFPHNTAPCDDLDPCSVNDVCAAGQCSGVPMDCSGSADQCNTAACDNGNCELTPIVGIDCDDNDVCTLEDACAADGSCVGQWDIFGCGCIDDTGCTDETDECHIGKCDVEFNTCYAEVQVGLACDDGEICSHTDQCNEGGVCEGIVYDCDDDNLCTDDSCNGDSTCANVANTLDCDDDNACTTADKCEDKACVGGPALPCDDGLFCTGEESCDPGSGCVDGTPPVIDDGVDCTIDSCDEDADEVVNDPDHAFCFSGGLCITDTCDPVNDCVQSVTPDCCGNGLLEGDEECDDANDVTGDGCSDACECQCEIVAARVCTQPITGLPSGEPAVGELVSDVVGVATATASGDLDGDGNLDLVIAYRGSENRLLLGNGSASPFAGSSATKITGDEHQTQAIVIVDINRDGHLDIVAGNDGEPNRLYLNNGSGAPFDQVVGQDITADADATYSLVVGDADMNGTPDVIAGNLFASNKIYANSGSLGAPFAGASGVGIGPETDATRALLLADYDRDGDLDLIAGNEGSPDRFYPNLGAPFFFFGTFGVDMGGGNAATFALEHGDVDGDGDVDVVGGIHGGDNKLYFNTGPPNFFFFPQDIGGVANNTRALALSDSDQDGDEDLLEVADGQPFHLFYNFGPPFPFIGFASGSGSVEAPPGRGMAAGDFDGDGDADLVTLDATGTARYYPGLEFTPFDGTVEPLIPNDAFTTVALAGGDADSDGAPDLIVGGHGLLPLALHRSNGSAAPWLDTNPRPIAFDLPQVDGVAAADLDHDGDLDVVAVSLADSPRLIAGDGSADGLTGSQPIVLGGAGEAAQAVAIGDLNRDGNPDVVASGADGAVRIYYSNGSAAPFEDVVAQVVPTAVGPASRVVLADLDGDGDLDIALAGLVGPDAVLVHDGTATPFSGPSEVALSLTPEPTHDLVVGDVDGNGTLDVITSSASGLTRFLTPAGAIPGVADATPVPYANAALALALADIDGNTSLDLIVGIDGVDEILLNDGGADPFTGATATPIALAADVLTRALLAGDFDRDGAADATAAHELLADHFHTNDALLDLLPTGMCAVQCTALPLECDDGLFCTGVETCDDGNRCLPGTPPTEEDEVECTFPECDEELDIVVQVPDHDFCDTGLLCSDDICDPEVGFCVQELEADCCGNAFAEAPEECDDGNLESGDGCLPDCTCECHITGPWLCTGGEAAPPFEDTNDFDVSGDSLAAKGGALGDLDGDGDLDVVVAVDGGPNRYYLNNGTAAPFDQVDGLDLTGDQHPSTAVALADVDTDGDLDVIVANLGGRTRLYLNNGTPTPFDSVVGSDVSDDEHDSVALAVGDVNADGHLDVIVGNDNQRNRVYLGAGGPTPFAGVVGQDAGTESDPTRALALGDVNGDGLLDLAAGQAFVPNKVYLNGGDPGIPFDGPSGVDLDTQLAATQDIVLVDVDRNGTLDFLTGNDLAVDRVYLNDYDWAGSPSAKPGQPVGTLPDATRAVAVHDVNRDGHLDFVLAAHLNRTRVLLGVGGATPFAGVTPDDVTTDNAPSVDVLLGDMDGDGDLDIVVVNATQPSRVYLSRAAPEAETVIDPAIGGSAGDSWATVIADLSGNGAPDVLVGRRGQPNDLYLNNGTISPFDQVLGSALDANTDDTRGLAVGDVDHDGDLDVLVGNFGQRTRLHLNNGTDEPFTGVTATDVTGDLHETWDAHLADLTGDGHLDAITVNDGQVTRVYPGDGSAAPFAATTGISLGSDAQPSRAAAIGDVDGDGDLDIVVANAGAANRLYLIDHEAAEPIGGATGVDITGDVHHTMAIALVDLDQDGDLDVIAGNKDQRDRVYYNNGTATPFAGVAGVDLTEETAPTTSLAVGDVDGDGTVDVVQGNDGTLDQLVLDPAGGSPATGTEIAGTDGSTKALALGLVDFDGGLDLFVARSQSVDLLLLNGPLIGADPPAGCTGFCPPTPLSCDDNNSCTIDVCDTLLGCNHESTVSGCCGNGEEEIGEDCDDGNQDDGDGCSSACELEAPP